MPNKKVDLIREYTDLLKNLDPSEILPDDDPDLLRMEEIMKKIKKIEEK